MKIQLDTSPARILLVGAGKYGMQHLETWQTLAHVGEVDLTGVVVRSARRRQELLACGVAVFDEITPDLLRSVDGVDIVTPSTSHAELVRQCIEHTNVLVEKPLGTTPAEVESLVECASRSGYVLMVNHLYRMHPVTVAMREIVSGFETPPSLISGTFLNPEEECRADRDRNLEFLHFFDVIDSVLNLVPEVSMTEERERTNRVSLRYPNGTNAVLHLGWQGNERERRLVFVYQDRSYTCDYLDNVIAIRDGDSLDKRFFTSVERPLERSLRHFALSIRHPEVCQATGVVGARIVKVATQAKRRLKQENPRIAVLGGGVFGATCALELSRYADVHLFERHEALLTEASYLNQWRLHSGFHYPRSLSTILEIQAARNEFESFYGEAIDREVTSYYCTSIDGREITRERYLEICSENNLNFSIEDPPPGLLDTSQISLSLRTDESVYSFERLRSCIQARLAGNPRISVKLGTEVTGGELRGAGQKVLHFRDSRAARSESFDYVVNATYANTNALPAWFGFPLKPVRFDLCEMIVLEMAMPRVSLTVLDGPFTSVVSIGDGTFILSHIHHSILKSAISRNGLPPEWRNLESNRDNLLGHAARFFPHIRHARFMESRYATRIVTANNEDFDGRPTVLTDHGFGIWSILGGKIVTSVANARELAAYLFPAATDGNSKPVQREVIEQELRHLNGDELESQASRLSIP